MPENNMLNIEALSLQVKEFALSIGFDACGFCEAKPIDKGEKGLFNKWLENGYHADMGYLANNYEKRINPQLLVENTKTIVSVALNYYPHEKQNERHPQFAYYAYGLDYHDVMKNKLNKLLEYIKGLLPKAEGRVFCDTAPLLERYWAAKAGLGFIGKNTLLIIPKKGSYFFLGEILLNTKLSYDSPLSISCGKCTRCLDTCPTNAIEEAHLLNAKKCISYQTIENKGEIADSVKPLLSNRIYGCDICQLCCPWNRYAKPHKTEEFLPNSEFLSLDFDTLNNLSTEQYQRTFKGSAIKRAKHSGLIRNIKALQKNRIQ